MLRDRIPELPRERKVLLIVDSVRLDELQYKGEHGELFQSPSITIIRDVDVFAMDGKNTLETDLVARNLVESGNSLVLNPYNFNSYEKDANSLENLAHLKIVYFGDIAHMLGAKSIDLKIDSKSVKDSQTALKASVHHTVFKSTLESQLNRIKNEYSSYSASFKSSGAPAAIDQARKFVAEHNLGSEVELLSLIRKCSAQNRLEQVKLVTSLTSDVTSNLMLAMKAGTPVTSGKVDFKKVDLDKFNIKVEIALDF
jgi:hypothetical protein